MIRKYITYVLIFLVIVFAFQNIQLVNVKFLFWEISIPRSLMLFSTLAIGLVTGWILPRRRYKKTARGKKQLKNKG